jgi:hypothetical protein
MITDLTARWAATIAPDRSTVFSGAGIWPLLVYAAAGTEGTERAELVAATASADPAEATAVAVHCPPDVIGDRVPWRRRCRSSMLDQIPLACRKRLYSDVCRVMTLESAPRGDSCRVLDHGLG